MESMRKVGHRARSLAVLLMAALAGCQGRLAPPVTSNSDQIAPAVTAKKVLAVYEGLLPCADCRGIRTELTLYAEDSTYKLVETYLGTADGDRAVRSNGAWRTLRGAAPGLPDAKVVRLSSAEPGELRDYLVVDDRSLRQLGRQGSEAEPRLSYTLTRKPPPV